MKVLVGKWFSILALSSLVLVGCQTSDTSESEATDETATSTDVENQEESADHEHDEDHGHDHDHDEEHDHDHSHDHDEESNDIYNGYFEDSQITDRALSDWEGDWQSVYPFLQDGTLDEVFAHKAEHGGDMTEEEYKEYYEIGYETDVDRIVIEDGVVTFFENGEEYSGEYVEDGYEILTYDAGNRGVRYIFKSVEESEQLPQYIQFSDHNIVATESDHYHLYWGNDREALLDEVTNWPTYYPSEMDGHDIAHEMIAH